MVLWLGEEPGKLQAPFFSRHSATLEEKDLNKIIQIIKYMHWLIFKVNIYQVGLLWARDGFTSAEREELNSVEENLCFSRKLCIV